MLSDGRWPVEQPEGVNIALTIHGYASWQEVKSDGPLETRVLYDLYPDFAIDVRAEQEALARASLIVWQHPMYWYGVPPLLKLWFDKVLAQGWAYGDGAAALAGKSVLWVVTTGAEPSAFVSDGMHGFPFEVFTAPIEQTARFCGMSWLPPIGVEIRVRAEHASDRNVAVGVDSNAGNRILGPGRIDPIAPRRRRTPKRRVRGVSARSVLRTRRGLRRTGSPPGAPCRCPMECRIRRFLARHNNRGMC